MCLCDYYVAMTRLVLALAGTYSLAGSLLFAHSDVTPQVHVGCSDHEISAKAVSTRADIQAFVRCAAEYLQEHGTAEARRAFNEDERWKYGPIYVFADGIAPSGEDSVTYVFPPDPSREGMVWGTSIDSYGTDYYFELDRILSIVDSGWIYYAFTNPGTGRDEPKSSYVIEVDWDGERAAIGAGIYSPDLPGTCHATDVNALTVDESPSSDSLAQLVRCAATMLGTKGYAALDELESGARWNSGSIYVFVTDTAGNQIMSGTRLKVNGRAVNEWAGTHHDASRMPFQGRDIPGAAALFGDVTIYYNAFNPTNWQLQGKVAMLRRVVADGVPLLLGAGYYLPPDHDSMASAAPCAEKRISARAIRTERDVEAFVRCAYELLMEVGPEAAREAFHEDERWRHDQFYVFVSGLAASGDDSISFVSPPDPHSEGRTWSSDPDMFGTDLFSEMHRIMEFVDAGWFYYSFRHPETRIVEAKASYVIEIDWNGHRAAIGAGLYRSDLPGTCRPDEVNASVVEADPSLAGLEELVACATYQAESLGHFAGPVLSAHPRWLDGSTYVFGVDPTTGLIQFSGNPGSYSVSGIIEEALFGGRKALQVSVTFGEAYWYYNLTNPATGMVEPKISYVRTANIQGKQLLVGSGISGPDSAKQHH